MARVREQLIQGGNGTMAEPPLSAGIVTYPHPAVSQADDLFALVEAALARGKAQIGRAGRDRGLMPPQRFRSQSTGSSATWFSPRISKWRCGP